MKTSDQEVPKATPLDLERAVERVKGGRVDDYAAVVVAYHERLRTVLAPWCPPGVDLSEVVHLAFIEAYRQLARFEPGTSFFAWLCTIGRFQLMTECERLRRQAKNQRHYSEHTLAQHLKMAAEREGELDETRSELLEQCLQGLQPEALLLIRRRYGEKLRVEMIAQALGRSASAVSVQLFELRRKLRDCIDRKWRALHREQC